MADTNNSRSRQDREQTELWTGGSKQSPCNHGNSRTKQDGKVTDKRWELNESRYPLYPPGPGDREAWARLIARFPEVEPTFCKDGHMLPEMQETESELRRTPDGNPSRVDLRLRAIGNGVVPAVAACAFIVLAEKLKKEVDIPDIIKEKLHE
tara:strand:+ start:283 stop:738 length:456 start_codon:yes stop_codon:yes gene_type:complete